MLTSIDIKNFQSLHHVALDLSAFTVIVGQSSSGKSAFTRAVRTLTSNRRGTDFISHGERTCTITARTERGTVALKRTRGTDSEYVIVPQDNPQGQTRFTKLGGETPPEVSSFLGIEAKEPINYASQFDKPYLLDASASEVARTLGALTNVNVIFEAARESNKRKLAAAATLRTRAADYAAVEAVLPKYRALRSHQDAIAQAEQHMLTAIQRRTDANALKALIEAHERAAATYDRVAHQNVLPIPTTEAIEHAAQQLSEYEALLTSLRSSRARINDAQAQQALADTAISEALNGYDEALRAAGTCPTCHQDTSHIAGAHA